MHRESGKARKSGKHRKNKKEEEKLKSFAGLLPRVFGWLIVIITLALSPTINTANEAIIAGNNTNLIGLAAIDDFGAPIIIIGLLFTGGVFGVAGIRGKTGNVSTKDMLSVVGAVVGTILALTLFLQVMTYVNLLIGHDATGFADVIYGIIPIVLYVGIIAGASAYGGVVYRKKGRGGGKTRSARP